MVELPLRFVVFLKLLQMFLSLEILEIFLKTTKQKDPSEIISRKGPFGASKQAGWDFFCSTVLPCTFFTEPLAKILLHCWFFFRLLQANFLVMLLLTGVYAVRESLKFCIPFCIRF